MAISVVKESRFTIQIAQETIQKEPGTETAYLLARVSLGSPNQGNSWTEAFKARDCRVETIPSGGGYAHILVLADQAGEEGAAARTILEMSQAIEEIGGRCLLMDLVNSNHPQATYDLTRLADGVVSPMYLYFEET